MRQQQDVGVQFAMDAPLGVGDVEFAQGEAGVDALRLQLLVASGDVDPAHGVGLVTGECLVLLAVAHSARTGAVV